MTISFKRKIIKGGCFQSLRISPYQRLNTVSHSKGYTIGFRLKLNTVNEENS